MQQEKAQENRINTLILWAKYFAESENFAESTNNCLYIAVYFMRICEITALSLFFHSSENKKTCRSKFSLHNAESPKGRFE